MDAPVAGVAPRAAHRHVLALDGGELVARRCALRAWTEILYSRAALPPKMAPLTKPSAGPSAWKWCFFRMSSGISRLLRQGSLVESDMRSLDKYRRSFGEAYETVVRTIRERLQLEPTGRPAKKQDRVVASLCTLFPAASVIG